MRITAYDGDQSARRTTGGTVVGPTPVVAASIVTVADAGAYFAGTAAEAVLAELGSGTLRSISPTQLTADTNNWNPTGLPTAQLIRASTDASRNLTGITAPTIEKVVILANVGSFALVLMDEDAASTAANRFACSGASDVTLAAGGVALLVYDLTTDRWRVVSGGGGGSSTLDGLTDVDTTGVADLDVLTYDSGSATWVPAAPTSGGTSFSGAMVHPTTQTFGAGSYTVIPFDGTEDYDTDAIHSTVTNNSRLTVPAGMGGKWTVWFSIYHANTGLAYIRKNGSGVAWGYVKTVQDAGVGAYFGYGSAVLELAAGDYVEVLYSAASGSLNNATTFGMYREAGVAAEMDYLDFATQASDPATPSGGTWRAYARAGGLYAKGSNGFVHDLGDGHGPARKYSPDRPPLTGLSLSDEFDDGFLEPAWTWTTTPAATVSETTYPGYLYLTGGTNNAAATYYLARAYAPGATAFTVAGRVSMSMENGNYTGALGVAVLDSSNAVVAYCAVVSDGTTTASDGFRLISTAGTHITAATLPMVLHPKYVMLNRTAANVYKFYVSADGIVWQYMGTSTVATAVAKVAVYYTMDTDAVDDDALVDFIRVFSTETRKIGA